ncbi:DNA-binding response regulator, OmpR family, contains REC and winged-helix (wHTH) domain [Ruminococcus flavefaciens]|uniref:Stage 0 sporulation protein A homolog n=1 Tax=Ruminococcus flavefaciens TaxID=1265 RepID=A0A1H6I414_RUMFL|nr:response regulator transcription factor [Ruminococcus flavefaciens]SEH42268.1 DNA-binding response regulator, OmpR family, contains REC and winged-helix (wHTH) domain [Ruminococcus flavefaciens]
MKKILLIEDDTEICEVIKNYFNTKGTEVSAVNSGGEAFDIIRSDDMDYELVLLDIMLPETDGFTLCRQLRMRSDIPVIFITARGREEDILYGYDLGCDDYIVKPFLLSVLYSKCEALVRRAGSNDDSKVLNCGGISLDTMTLRCFAEGTEVELPPKEFAILRYLLEHENWVVTRDTLLDRIWGYDYFGSDRVVDNHIKKLRKALGSAGAQIKTLVGRGYKLTKE